MDRDLSSKQLETLLNESLSETWKCRKPRNGESDKSRHGRLSQAFVNATAKKFSCFFPHQESYWTFCRSFHKPEEPDEDPKEKGFGLHELLFDIHVCQFEMIPSLKESKNIFLPIVKRAIWHIESELDEHDSGKWLKDFNKLVVGSAPFKMFIGPYKDGQNEAIKKTLRTPAEYASGKLFLALIPHPRHWKNFSKKELLKRVCLWQYPW